MAKGHSRIKAENLTRAMEIRVTLNNKNKPAENAGILATIVNELHDVLRKHFCAHQIKVELYREPEIPNRLRVRGADKGSPEILRSKRSRK